MEQRIIAQFADDCGCSVTGGDKGFTFSRCKLHAAAPALLEALENIVGQAEDTAPYDDDLKESLAAIISLADAAIKEAK